MKPTTKMDIEAHCRLMEERDGLQARISKLETFISLGGLGALGYEDATDLHEQLAHMRHYLACLQRRLDRQRALQ